MPSSFCNVCCYCTSFLVGVSKLTKLIKLNWLERLPTMCLNHLKTRLSEVKHMGIPEKTVPHAFLLFFFSWNLSLIAILSFLHTYLCNWWWWGVMSLCFLSAFFFFLICFILPPKTFFALPSGDVAMWCILYFPCILAIYSTLVARKTNVLMQLPCMLWCVWMKEDETWER